MKTNFELPVPVFYKPENARAPEYSISNMVELQNQAVLWRNKFGLKISAADAFRIHLLIIDAQRDFGFPEGALFVGGRSGAGAMDDHGRLAQFIYRNLHRISHVTCTMDTHLPYQIFHPAAHILADGSHPSPMTIISADDYRKGKYLPNPAMASQLNVSPVWLRRQFIHYSEELEKKGKYQLTIWPYHCLLGSVGYQLAGVIEEARLFHSFARGAANVPEIKGGNPLTEHYSIFKPEVMTLWTGDPIPHVQKNTGLIETLLKGDMVIITGQAKSHCLAWTIQDFLTEIQAIDPVLAKKVYLLEDCASAVVVPGIVDYTDSADAAFKKFADAGMRLVKSTEPMESWPDVKF